MRTKHTPEPWVVCALHDKYFILKDLPDMQGRVGVASLATENKRAAANAERIVACVNACAGIANPAALGDVVEMLRWAVVQMRRAGMATMSMEDALAALGTEEE